MKIVSSEGAGALWRGLVPTLVMAVPATVVYFTAYDRLRDWMGSEKVVTPILAGSSARTLAATLISPLELIRTKMQAEPVSGISGQRPLEPLP